MDDEGNRHPFGAGGVFVRLVSASGGKATTGFASGDGGAYRATVVVPEGGIGGILIGLRGFVSGPTGSSTSDMYFPITNNPLEATAVASPRGAADEAAFPEWPAALAASLIVLTGLAIALRQRRRLRGALGRVGGLGAR